MNKRQQMRKRNYESLKTKSFICLLLLLLLLGIQVMNWKNMNKKIQSIDLVIMQ